VNGGLFSEDLAAAAMSHNPPKSAWVVANQTGLADSRMESERSRIASLVA